MTKNKTNDELRDIITTFGWLYLSDDSPIDNSPTDLDSFTKSLMTELTRNYRIEPKGKLIKPGDRIYKGDRVRIEYVNGAVIEETVDVDKFTTVGIAVYLLDRADPDENFKFPTKEGSLILLSHRGDKFPVSAILKGGSWLVAGEKGSFNSDKLRKKFCNFKVVGGEE